MEELGLLLLEVALLVKVVKAEVRVDAGRNQFEFTVCLNYL
jgi:hypothetical protein